MIKDKIEVNIAGGLDIPMPKMVTVRQKFDAPTVEDIPALIESEFLKPEIQSKVTPGQSVAVGCGSRGIANIDTIAKSVIEGLKSLGAKPFIFPCGDHERIRLHVGGDRHGSRVAFFDGAPGVLLVERAGEVGGIRRAQLQDAERWHVLVHAVQ